MLRRIKSVWINPGFLFLNFFLVTNIFGTSLADETDSLSLNWAYQSGIGDGLFIATPENAHIYNLPFSYTFRNVDNQNWALEIKFPLTVGIYNIEASRREIDLDIMAVQPGVELQIPLRENWLLMPSTSFGAGKDTSGGRWRYLYAGCIKHQVFIERKKLDITFANALRYDGYSAEGNGRNGYIPSFITGLDIRFPMGFNLFNKPGHLSFYGVYHHYFDGVAVVFSEEKKFEVNNQRELGFTIGTIPGWRVWRFPIERIGFGYRSGGRFSSVRLVFGMPF
jgi:hypothetical protein